jgi:hypothetical protein
MKVFRYIVDFTAAGAGEGKALVELDPTQPPNLRTVAETEIARRFRLREVAVTDYRLIQQPA